MLFKSLSFLIESFSCFIHLMLAEDSRISVVLEFCSRCPLFLLLQLLRRVSNGRRKQKVGSRI